MATDPILPSMLPTLPKPRNLKVRHLGLTEDGQWKPVSPVRRNSAGEWVRTAWVYGRHLSFALGSTKMSSVAKAQPKNVLTTAQ